MQGCENGVGIKINVSCIFVTCVRRPGSQDEQATANWDCGEDCEVIGCVVSFPPSRLCAISREHTMGFP